MYTANESFDGSFAAVAKLVGNKWKLLIIGNLLDRKRRFNEMRRAINGISQKTLTDNLRELERDAIVHREVFAEIPPKVEYSLTKLGESLKPVFDSMIKWGEWYRSASKQTNNQHQH